MAETKKKKTVQERLAEEKEGMKKQMSAASSIVDTLGDFSEDEQTAICNIVVRALGIYISSDC